MFKPSSLHCSLVVSLSGPFRARFFLKMRPVRCARTCSSLTLAVWTAWPEASLVPANWSRRASWRKPWKQGAHIKQLAFKQYHRHLTPCWMLHMPSAYANGAISAVGWNGESLRYSSWSTTALAKKVEDGKASLEEIEAYALKTSEPKTSSGKQDGATFL